MRTRSLLLCALSVSVLASGGVATAGKKCNIVSDAPGDVVFLLAPKGMGPNGSALDITSVDVATGRKKLVVVLRLASTDAKASQYASFGVTYQVQFSIGGVDHSFGRKLAQGASTYTDTATAGGTAISGLTVTSDAKSITWTVPRANVPKLKGKNIVLTGFFAQASGSVGHDYAPDDSHPSNATYPDRAPSCVHAA